jgi:hypothetical protein
MRSPRVVLSSRLSIQEHGEPIVRGLRDLTKISNDQDVTIEAIVTRLQNLRVPSLAQIVQALQASGSTRRTSAFPRDAVNALPAGDVVGDCGEETRQGCEPRDEGRTTRASDLATKREIRTNVPRWRIVRLDA